MHTQLQALVDVTENGLAFAYFNKPAYSPAEDFLIDWSMNFSWVPEQMKKDWVAMMADPDYQSVIDKFKSKFNVDPSDGVEDLLDEPVGGD